MKKELRTEFKKRRCDILHKKDKSLKICNNFLNSDTYKNAKIILCYASLNDEVDTEPIVVKALSDGKMVALPKCMNKDGFMKYYIIHSLNDAEKGAFGIYEPVEQCEELTDFIASVCIVPALSFDKDGYRLGYGKGFYDRFLEDYCFPSVGLCFADLIAEALPRNQFDRKVSTVITENEIFFCKGE